MGIRDEGGLLPYDLFTVGAEILDGDLREPRAADLQDLLSACIEGLALQPALLVAGFLEVLDDDSLARFVVDALVRAINIDVEAAPDDVLGPDRELADRDVLSVILEVNVV